MTAEKEFSPEQRENTEMREKVQELTDYLLEIALKLDHQLNMDEANTTSHETETLKTQVGLIQNRLIHCCDGKLRRERPNSIFQEIADLMTNEKTKEILEAKIRKGVHDER